MVNIVHPPNTECISVQLQSMHFYSKHFEVRVRERRFLERDGNWEHDDEAELSIKKHLTPLKNYNITLLFYLNMLNFNTKSTILWEKYKPNL